MLSIGTDCAIPTQRVTRWKQGKKGIAPVVAPMSKLISTKREHVPTEKQFDMGKIGRKTAAFTVESIPDIPMGLTPANLKDWFAHCDGAIHQYMFGGAHGSFRLKTHVSVEQSRPDVIVPRGTWIGCAEGKVVNRPKGLVRAGREKMDPNTVYGAMCPYPRA